MKKLSIIFVLALILSLIPIVHLHTPVVAASYNTTIYSSASDGDFVAVSITSYNTVWVDTNSTYNPTAWFDIGQGYNYVSDWEIWRSCMYFNTSAIPSGATIVNASVYLYGLADSSTQDFNVVIQNGQPTYPHDPAVTTDYNKSYYSGNGGQLATSTWTLAGYNIIVLNADGKSWINKGGQTKFMVRSSRDIAGTEPSFGVPERVSAYASEGAGTSKDPYLYVEYTLSSTPSVSTLPASSVTYNSARINGNITDDGDDTCEARFRWLKSADEPEPPWLNNFTHRIKLTTDQTDIDSDLTDFPILLYLSTSSGRNAEDVSFIFDELTADANRKKIAVTKSDGLTQCYVEIEKWDDANEHAWLWAKAPSVNGTADSDFWLYYDADASDNTAYVGDINDAVSANVWDANYKAVYHMRDATTSSIYDSTSGGFDGTKKAANNPAVTTSGKISDAQDFEYTTSASYVSSSTPLHCDDTDSELTIEAWYKGESDTGANQVLYGHIDEGDFYLGVATSTKKPFLSLYEASSGWISIAAAAGLTLDGSTWYHLAGTWKKNDYLRLYKDASAETPVAVHDEWQADANLNVRIGSWTDGGYNTDGLLDELRISNVARSAAWVKATYESGRDNLLDWGTAEAYPWTETSWQNSLETGDTFYEDLAGLDSATEYAYQAQARNDAGTSDWTASAYFTTCPAAPTNVSASDGEYTDKVVINWTKSTGATGYKVYRDAVLVDTLGDVATYNDTGADAGIITPGTASATDGIHTDKVVVSLSGESVSNGTAHNYTVKAYNDGGDSPASSPDSGYRSVGSLVYQWLVSSGDADSDYSNIGGGTTNPYDYMSAPAPTINGGNATASDGTNSTIVTLTLANQSATGGAGRYYLCTLSATGAADQNSTSDRGYRGTTSLVLQWLMSAADSDADYSEIAGATTNPYDDTGGAIAPDGRYYKCIVNMTGATSQNSTPDRGYMVAIVPPTVTASAATSITSTSAILHGDTTDTGWENATTRGFEWGTASGNYTDNWTEAGSFGTGAFDHTINGLASGTQYFWRAFAINSAGQGNSSELDFTTLLLPGPPLNFTITQTGPNSISINWTMGVSANGTEIRVSTSQYPGAVTEGYLTYNGTETGVNIDGLSLNTTVYYYRAWSWNTYGYSEDYAEAQIGSAAEPAGTTIPDIAPGLILAVGLSGFALWKRGWIRILLALSVVTWGAFAMSYDIKIAAPLIAIGTILFFMGILPFIEHKEEEVA